MLAMTVNQIPVVDLFAGPGGLGEGFSGYRTKSGLVFEVRLAVEKEFHAHSTLKLRRFFWLFEKENLPEEYYGYLRGEISLEQLYNKYPHEAEMAGERAWLAELGSIDPNELDTRLEQAVGNNPVWVLIGGPPCQAYSTVGRSRNKGIKNYIPENDDRHFLYREYLRILSRHWPAVFIMENVRGILSARVNGDFIFDRIMKDLENPGAGSNEDPSTTRHRYRVFSLATEPSSVDSAGQPRYVTGHDFTIKSEDYGIPQARHRVILLGVRDDIDMNSPPTLTKRASVSARSVLNTLPRLRSGFSNGKDTSEKWLEWLRKMRDEEWLEAMRGDESNEEIYREIVTQIESLRRPYKNRGDEFVRYKPRKFRLAKWFVDERIGGVCNSSTRSHMAEDLYRYFFAACYTKAKNQSPVLCDFPEGLLPHHRSAQVASRSGGFADRFRVQCASRPSTTIMSHISKDGHYYIHYDPTQCRSLTVREAARLQTFPDNYFFCGPRTQQYIQVGNAVPPFLAYQIAEIVFEILSE